MTTQKELDLAVDQEPPFTSNVKNPAKRKVASPGSNSASGTEHNDGAKIHAAVQAQQRAALLAYPAKGRSASEWRARYEEALRETRIARSKESVK
jgi:hypothetical protein